MTPEEIAEKDAATAAAKAEAEQAEADSQRKAEQEKKGKRTEAEKAAYALVKTAERLKSLGGDPKAVLGSDVEDDESDEDDDRPVTFKDLKRIDAEKAEKSADKMADEIEDETERGEVKQALKNVVKSSGNPAADLANARAIVNAEKNRQIAEEAERGRAPKRSGSGSGGPAKGDDEFKPTDDEAAFMRPPFNMTKEKILEVRKKERAGK